MKLHLKKPGQSVDPIVGHRNGWRMSLLAMCGRRLLETDSITSFAEIEKVTCLTCIKKAKK